MPVGWSVLKLGLGLSGIFNILGSSTALAESGFPRPTPTDNVTVTPPLAELGLDTDINRDKVNQRTSTGNRTVIKASHPQSQPGETARSFSTPSPTELSFHPAPLITEMGPLTRTLTSHEEIAHNHNQHPARQAEHQPKFSPGYVVPRTPSEIDPTAASVPRTKVRLPRDKAPLDIAKLSEPVTLSALSQPTTNHTPQGNAEKATAQPDVSLEALIAGSLAKGDRVNESLIPEEIVDSIVDSTESVPSEIEFFPDSNDPEALEIESDIAPEVLSDALEASENENLETTTDELGTLRVQPTRSRASEELGILRLMQTAQAPPPPPKPPISFLTGRLGFFSSENAFRSNPRIDESIYQSGLAYYLFPKLADGTSLYAIAETNLARYDQFQSVNYNELEVQLGIRQRLLPRTHAQIGWRNQRLYSPGYRDKLFSVNYIDTMVSHRSILNSKTWVDGFYQARLGFANPEAASRFRQTFTVSLNYGATRDLRTSLLYQLDFDDYTQVSRYDTYQQLLGIVSYNLTPESRISIFGGTRFGRSSSPGVNLDDTFYGAGLNVSVPLF